MTTDQIAGLVCIVAGLLVPAVVIAWQSARETLREARERWGR